MKSSHNNYFSRFDKKNKGLPSSSSSKELKKNTAKKPKPIIRAPEEHSAGSLIPLNKFLSHAGIASRREAADLIRAGKVKVNGELITEPGFKVNPKDEVRYLGKKVIPSKHFVYILLNKPKDCITTTRDPEGRKTVMDIIRNATAERVFPVGRLDRNTSGVLLLTNDGELAQMLTHPSHQIKKVYQVTLNKSLAPADFERLKKGIMLEDGEAAVDDIAYINVNDRSQLGVEIHSGRNRIIRRMFEHLGYEVKYLDRVVFAGLTKKNLPRGKWRFLTPQEVRNLKYIRKGKS
ncbi:MAG: rRNA pseudouridine synthase [Chitinophagaceae bacterium]|nr:rRNA pseudouridine synthase [Chitinophagaceae bacterium]